MLRAPSEPPRGLPRAQAMELRVSSEPRGPGANTTTETSSYIHQRVELSLMDIGKSQRGDGRRGMCSGKNVLMVPGCKGETQLNQIAGGGQEE